MKRFNCPLLWVEIVQSINKPSDKIFKVNDFELENTKLSKEMLNLTFSWIVTVLFCCTKEAQLSTDVTESLLCKTKTNSCTQLNLHFEHHFDCSESTVFKATMNCNRAIAQLLAIIISVWILIYQNLSYSTDHSRSSFKQLYVSASNVINLYSIIFNNILHILKRSTQKCLVRTSL